MVMVYSELTRLLKANSGRTSRAFNSTPNIDCYWVGAVPNLYHRPPSQRRSRTFEAAGSRTPDMSYLRQP